MAAIDGGKVKSRILHARLLAPQRCHHDIAADALLRPPAPRSIRAVSADSIFILVHQRDRRVHCLWEAHARLYRHCDMAADAGLPLQHGRAQRGIRAVSADRQRERRVHCLLHGKHDARTSRALPLKWEARTTDAAAADLRRHGHARTHSTVAPAARLSLSRTSPRLPRWMPRYISRFHL